uniref:Uncharacterized protein n=1 Tax=Panagrolaimus superbus TaxID=310955 RepID=A0A914Z3Z6_9BILA
MTWQPRNSGEDSDDDDDGNDTSLELSTNDLKPSNEVSSIRGNFKSETDLDSPKKSNKIWSIADTIDARADSAASNTSSTSKSSSQQQLSSHQEEKPIFPTTSTNLSSLLGQTPPTSSSTITNNNASTNSIGLPNPAATAGFPNQMFMQAMAANRLPMPQQLYAFMQQQQQHHQAAQVQQAAAAFQQQQQIAAMLRNAGNLHPMLFNNFLMNGGAAAAMNGLSNLNSIPPQPSTSSRPNSPSPNHHDPANTSSIDCGWNHVLFSLFDRKVNNNPLPSLTDKP